MRYLIFLLLSGCSYHNCSFNPGLTSMLVYPAKKYSELNISEVYSDPFHNVSVMAKCKF